MGVKLGSFTIPGPGNFSVTGVGFKPRWVIFLFGNKGVEDTWLDDACGGIAWTALKNSTVDASGVSSSIRTTMQSERWYPPGNVVAGSFLGDITMWVRQTNGSNGWAMFTSSLDADGFTFTFDPDFTTGAGGQIVYYLAGDEQWEEVGCRAPFIPGSPAHTLNWQPMAFFGIGSGGGLGPDGSDQSFSLFDQSIPTVCCGDWGEYTPGNFFEMNSTWRGLLDPNVDVQEWWGYESSTSPVTIIEPTQTAGVQWSDIFHASRTDTTFSGIVQAGSSFSNSEGRMAPFVLGSTDSRIGQFVPTNTIGVPTHVDVGFTPEAVIFFSPGPERAGIGGTSVQGATGWGFCTENEEALLIYGGYWNPPNAMTSAMKITRNQSWVSNCTEVLFSIGSMVTAGSARVTPGGFDYTTLENAAVELAPILYWAIAPAAEAPGFFRVVHR